MEKKDIELSQSYLTLPSELHSIIKPYNNHSTSIELLNENLIDDLGLNKEFLSSEDGVLFLSGSTDKYGTLFSQSYAGHQYGHFTNLGDGRAVLLGEVLKDNKLYDIQLKGSGRTPYSRSGDGKATLYSMLREYLISEAMYHLGVPTTRSLAVLNTNELIPRMNPEKGGILVRVASSHIRVGTFEYARANGKTELLKELLDYSIERHYKHLHNKKDKYQQFLREVVKNQAILISKWQSLGFVHGVMNTDNMTISGETIDYGPCAFLDIFDPSISFSSIDNQGRYSYKNQPFIGSWNLARFAESILILLDKDMSKAIDKANSELEKYQTYFEESYYDLFGKKLGMISIAKDERYLIDEILLIMEKYNADFTNTFRLLTLDKYEELPFFETEDFTLWFQKWTRQLGYRQLDPKERITLMEKHNPVLIPRNELVEEALVSASKENDYSLFIQLFDKLSDPYNYQVVHDLLFIEPINKTKQFVTYCGT